MPFSMVALGVKILIFLKRLTGMYSGTHHSFEMAEDLDGALVASRHYLLIEIRSDSIIC